MTRQLSVSKSVVVVVGDSIQPGKRQAILVLASGEQLKLDSLVQEVTEQEGVAIRIIDGALNYKQSDSVKLLCNAYHQLIIPRGGEYMMQLTDGTKVWLNAATEFRYPAAFVGAERKVYLSGEAYFEVAKDSLHPFIVVADDAQIRVYGTKFDVSNYGTGNIRTVLVEGAVGMQRGQEEVRLKPGQKGETDGDHIRVTEVDVASYIAWKNGDFIFDNERLEDIIEQISRWYDVDVFYSREQSRDIRLSGDLRRYKEVQSLLYYFERISDIRFSIKGRTIVVE